MDVRSLGRSAAQIVGLLGILVLASLSVGFLVYGLGWSEFSWSYKQEDPCARGDGPYLEDRLGRSIGAGLLAVLVFFLLVKRGRRWHELTSLDRVAMGNCRRSCLPIPVGSMSF